MHPARVTHLNVEYSLRHLAQNVEVFEWRGSDRIALSFSVRVRYSPHCYSEVAAGPPFPEGCYIIRGLGKARLFSPERHAYSLHLPAFIGELFRKPATSVSLTREANWSIYRMAMNPPLRPNHRYYLFFRVKVAEPRRGGNRYRLDLYVESAYQRGQGVKVVRHFPFGTVAERIAKGIRI